MTRFRCALPFGAELEEDGTAVFRLWAPAAETIVLELAGEGRALPMQQVGDGWFERRERGLAPGMAYAYRLPGGLAVPDPASRAQAGEVHGPSLLVDPRAFEWRCGDWAGRPWHETVLYELHLGTFSPEGTYDGLCHRLDRLAELGVTAVELMPLADFRGRRNWGYDGVLPFAPARAYGTPEDLKRLVDAAHARGLMVFLDVVYNHFGPEGNYLGLYAPGFFTERHHTPWGAAIDFARREVRDFFLHNALYWLMEYRFDGLRFDAVHAILDDSEPHILTEIARAVRQGVEPGREVHLVLENLDNEAHYLRREETGASRAFTAQWNDDCHHAAHVLATGEDEGYYGDYAKAPVAALGRALAEGFVYQGEVSAFHGGTPRGEPSADLPPTAFVDFLQNHDQVGNRAFGERLSVLAEPAALDCLAAVLLLAPAVPLLFMGEEWGSRRPFLYFCDYEGELAAAVRDGRRREFAQFQDFARPERRARIPDPNAPETFAASCLDWQEREAPGGARQLAFHRRLLSLRQREIVPRLAGVSGGASRAEPFGASGLLVGFRLGDGSRLSLTANLGSAPAPAPPRRPPGRLLYESRPALSARLAEGVPPWSCCWQLEEEGQ